MKSATKKNLLICGGSGLIGRALSSYLQNQGFAVSILSRNRNNSGPFRSFYWNPDEDYLDPEALKDQHYLINLSGESIAGGWLGNSRKKKILQSRRRPLMLLSKELEKLDQKPLKLISASAVGFYGHQPNVLLTETAPAGTGYLAEVCAEWESCLEDFKIPVAALRIGVVLSQDGGYYPKMKKILKSRINLVFGTGEQFVSWIHIDDLVRAIHFILLHPQSSAVYNLCSPEPIKVSSLQTLIAQQAGYKVLRINIPSGIVKFLLQSLSEIFLHDQQAIPHNLLAQGFQFELPKIEKILQKE